MRDSRPRSIHGIILAGLAVAGIWSTPVRAVDDAILMACYEATLDTRGDKAIEACGKALASGIPLGPKLARVLNNRGLGYLKNSEQKGRSSSQVADDLYNALDYFNRAIRIDPKNVFAYDNRASAYRLREEPERALDDYNKALEIDPTMTSAYLGRGKAYEALGDRSRARAEYRSALSQTGTRPIDKWAREDAQRRLEMLDKPQADTAQSNTPQSDTAQSDKSQ